MDICPYRTKLYTNTKYETDSEIKQESVLALCVLIHFGISSGLAKGECRCWRYIYSGPVEIHGLQCGREGKDRDSIGGTGIQRDNGEYRDTRYDRE